MLSYCLKCKEIQKVKILKLQGLKTEECFYQNMQCVIVKNQNVLKKKNLKDY